MKMKAFASLLVDGKEVTKRQGCWLTIHFDGENAKVKVSRKMSFKSRSGGLGVMRFFESQTGKRWLMDVDVEGRLSRDFTTVLFGK